MATGIRNVLQLLKDELKFLEAGGYERSQAWRPSRIFLDSPICINYRTPVHHSCWDCALMNFVPSDRRGETVPCDYIPLNCAGETVDSLYRGGTPAELEFALRVWLHRTITKLEHSRKAAPDADVHQHHADSPTHDADEHKGSFENGRPLVSFSGQLAHRGGGDEVKDYDSDFPEPGGSPEHSGQRKIRNSD